MCRYTTYFQHILHQNNGYFIQVWMGFVFKMLLFQFFLCEILNLVIVVFNIYLTNFFLGGRFMRQDQDIHSFTSSFAGTAPGWQTTYPMIKHQEGTCQTLCAQYFLLLPGFQVLRQTKPKFCSCTFHSVGTAAGEQKFNSICILSLNIINEKVMQLKNWSWHPSKLPK